MFLFFKISREDGIGWICVRARDRRRRTERDDDYYDVDGLLESWERLLESGRPVCLQTITELAHMHKVLTGKWLFHVTTGLKVNHVWEIVARTTVNGELGTSAKVSPYEGKQGESYRHVVCVYNDDFTNTEEVLALENKIRACGIKFQLLYKPDAFTHLGIYRNNAWKLRPTIHESVFDLATNCSKVTSVK